MSDPADNQAELDRFAEVETGEAFTLQNGYLLKVELSETTVVARQGAMGWLLVQPSEGRPVVSAQSSR